MSDKRIVILGAGPTGLGAAYRLQELGYDNWAVYDANDEVGGLARSFADENGFLWDIGGHVMFSHYEYFDKLVDILLGEDYTELQRESWVWIMDRFTPYPFQNNIHRLPKEVVLECVQGLIQARDASIKGYDSPPEHFGEWMRRIFGPGIVKHFMEPYNFKVWAHPKEMMSHHWLGERVAVVDVERVLRNVILDQDDVSWGPNATFKYPLYDGTGGLYKPFRRFIEDKLTLNIRAERIDPKKRTITFDDGTVEEYDVLVSTIPLDKVVKLIDGCPSEVVAAADELSYSGGLFVGIGVGRELDTEKCWMYYPETSSPFYRVTYLSHYSRNMAPEGCFSMLTETSYSPHKHEDKTTIVDRVIEGMRNTKLLEPGDEVVSRWLLDVDQTYPVPTIKRDPALRVIQGYLMGEGIFSRGRFGAWMYEIGNMDHSVMQGVEVVNSLLTGEPETTWTGAQAKPLPELPERLSGAQSPNGAGHPDQNGASEGKTGMEATQAVHGEEMGDLAAAE